MKLKKYLISPIIIFTLFSCKHSGESVFTDRTYQDTLKQNIGGFLIREIHYSDDFQSWINDINYSYKDSIDSISNIGSGTYYAEEPPKEEQLIRLKNWIILKTSGDRDKDLLFICDNKTKIWCKYEISPKTIEQADLWKAQNIDSQLENWDTISKITEIDQNGNVIVLYSYAKNKRIFSFITGKRQIKFRINLQTGRPEMTEVTKI